MMRRKPELLVPAGDMEKLKMAVLYGADAVYLAGTAFGMRAFAGNFTPEELPRAVDFAHRHGLLFIVDAAQTAGAAALLFEWAVIRGNQPYFTGSSVKNYITRGAEREERMQYPNRDWGFGRMDLYHTFELLA